MDDHHEDLEKDLDEIDDYLEKKGFSLKVLTSKKGERIDEYMSTDDIDIILADKNLGKATTGEMVVNDIRKKHFLTDILYYSGVSIDDSDYIRLGKHMSVEIIKDRKFVPTLKKMIDKNLSKWDDVVFLRGMIISNTIEVETKVNEFFTKYFQVAESELEHFDLILEGTAISLEGKKTVLTKIIKNKGWKEFESLNADIRALQDERNILAHSKLDPSSKSFVSRGEHHVYDKVKMMKTLKRADTAYMNLEKLIQKLD